MERFTRKDIALAVLAPGVAAALYGWGSVAYYHQSAYGGVWFPAIGLGIVIFWLVAAIWNITLLWVIRVSNREMQTWIKTIPNAFKTILTARAITDEAIQRMVNEQVLPLTIKTMTAAHTLIRNRLHEYLLKRPWVYASVVLFAINLLLGFLPDLLEPPQHGQSADQ